jgi:hypothetical protein
MLTTTKNSSSRNLFWMTLEMKLGIRSRTTPKLNIRFVTGFWPSFTNYFDVSKIIITEIEIEQEKIEEATAKTGRKFDHPNYALQKRRAFNRSRKRSYGASKGTTTSNRNNF